MTNPPPSPYGPSSSPQPPYSPQQPPMFYRPEVPYGYTVVGPTPPKRGNGPGLAALILGIVSVVFAFIPLVGFLSFLLGTAGIIVGIVGLVLAHRPRRAAAWGLALSAASMVIAFVMIIVYVSGFFSAVDSAFDEATRNSPTAEASPFAPETAAPIQPSSDPLPLGSMVTLADDAGVPVYEASVTASVLDSDATITGFEGNPAPPAGMQWALAQVEVHALGDGWTSPAYDLTVEYIDADGMQHDEFEVPAVAPDVRLDSIVDLTLGERAAGFVVIAVPTENPAGGQWSIHLDTIVGGDGERHFFEAE